MLASGVVGAHTGFMASVTARSEEVAGMSNSPDASHGELGFLDELIDAHIDISGYVLQIGERTWAIHATIPVDGGVLVAEYDSAEEANDVLGQLAPNHSAAGLLATGGERDGLESWPSHRERSVRSSPDSETS